MVTQVSERKIPLIIHILLLIILVYKSITQDNIPELFYFFVGSIISSFIALILVFFKKKASLHMLGIGALTVFCICSSIYFHANNMVFLTFLLLCNGFVASSRLYMKAHTLKELIAGYIIGILPQLILLFFWL
jgi:membrane-associated phospholipid phosphatase